MTVYFKISALFVLLFFLQCILPVTLKAENSSGKLNETSSGDGKTGHREMNLFCPSKENRAVESFQQGIDLAEKKEFKESLKMYLKAIELDPLFCDAMDNLGIIYQKGGNSNEAIYWHQKAVEVNFKDPVAHINLGADFRLQNRLRESADEYKVVIEIDPKNPEGYFGLGSDYLAIGKSKEALQELKIAEKLYLEKRSPYLIHARYSIGLAYFFLNDCVSAKSYLEPVYPEFKNDPNINYSLGVCFLRSKETEKGKSYLLNAKSQGMEQAENVLEMIENGEIK